jgi:hypothetical protein
MARPRRRVIMASPPCDYRLAAIRAAGYAGGSTRKMPPRADDTASRARDHRRMSATDLRHRIRLLEIALASAAETGLDDCDHYRRSLEDELEWCRMAFVEAAVVEIAVLRAAVGGPLVG